MEEGVLKLPLECLSSSGILFLSDLIEEADITQTRSIGYILSELSQVYSVCHYLIERSCFTIIKPSKDDWAFDMFQSLNATGTPLTAIETFKPLAVNTTEQNERQFKGTRSEKSFCKVEELFEKTNTAAQKSKLTNDFLTSFVVAYDGS